MDYRADYRANLEEAWRLGGRTFGVDVGLGILVAAVNVAPSRRGP